MILIIIIFINNIGLVFECWGFLVRWGGFFLLLLFVRCGGLLLLFVKV